MPFFGCCTADSQTDAGRHQLNNNGSLVLFSTACFLCIFLCQNLRRSFAERAILPSLEEAITNPGWSSSICSFLLCVLWFCRSPWSPSFWYVFRLTVLYVTAQTVNRIARYLWQFLDGQNKSKLHKGVCAFASTPVHHLSIHPLRHWFFNYSAYFDNMTPSGTRKSVTKTDCHIKRWFSVYEGHSKNCHIKRLLYYPVSYYTIGTVFRDLCGSISLIFIMTSAISRG